MQPRSAQNLYFSAPTARPLQISTERNGDSVTIALYGELDLASTEELDRAIRDCEETEIGAIVIDFSEVVFIDSSGLSALLSARKRIAERLHFIPSRHEAVQRLLVMTRTVEILH